MSTASSTAQLNEMIARVKTYQSPTLAKTAGAMTSNRIYAWQAPDKAPFPHVVIRKQNSVTDPEFANLREQFEVEAMCFTHQRVNNETTAEELADVVEQALITWRESASLSFSRSARRDRLSFNTPPANGDVIGVRLLIDCVAWPTRNTLALTQ